MILIRVNAEANFKICIIESKNPRKSSKISKKISFVSITITINACASSDSPRSWSPFQTFVQRALRSGIIFLTRRHRKLGRTRVVDTVHSSLSLSFPLLFRPCVCPPALESRIEIGIGVSRSLQITFDRPSHTRGPFTKPVQTYHESRRVNRGFHNSSKLTLDRACILYWEAKQLGIELDLNARETKFDGVRRVWVVNKDTRRIWYFSFSILM